MPTSPVPIGETFANKYRVERIIGEGGMGIVVAAQHLELDQLVAVKFLLEDIADHDEGAERFRREARAAAKIHSDHVVRVLDVGILPDGVRYMVMEYLEGRDLAEELALCGSLPQGVACGILLEALDAVAHAHAVGIIHRDLKPANLYLARRHDGAQRVKVLDFGISKSIGAGTKDLLSLTKTSAWIGSPLYMAPEQMQSARDVDERADVWSMGAILYEMLCGRPPYEAESLPQLCSLLLSTDPRSIAERVPGVHPDLAAAVMGCLVRDPERRTQSATQLAKAIARHATTVTGSGVRLSLLDITELQSDARLSPASALSATPPRASSPGLGTSTRPSAGVPLLERSTSDGPHSAPGSTQEAQSRATPHPSTSRSGAASGDPPAGNTHAAWGGTDPALSRPHSQKSKVGRWGLVALLALSAGVGGFFAMKSSAISRGVEQDEAGLVAAQAEGSSPVIATQASTAPEKPSVPDVAPSTSDTNQHGVSPVASPHGAGPSTDTKEEPSRKDVSGSEASHQQAKKPASPAAPPPPVSRPRPRPVSAARVPAVPAEVEPTPAPQPPPAPAKRDSFSDFGGRR